ncbi:MAG: SGNH/GDSL hydrolase family protein [Candidatus Omnitrophica bacterium]|nr:SGNH/GDSL hydrolase family protein [Candidatus Omnitrophota bacterium]
MLNVKYFLVNIFLIIFSTTLCICLSAYILYFYALASGALIENNYICEPRPFQWVEEPVGGYRNKPNFRHWAFGRIDGRTNAEGFRSQNEFSLKAAKGVIRIVGLGDSVMEGARVNVDGSFLGILESIIKAQGRAVETINAGVCGYSTYQERCFLERYIVQLNPDIVLINFCPNDLLPSEDPFRNSSRIIVRYLEGLLGNSQHQFSEIERSKINDAIALLRGMTDLRVFLKSVRQDQALEQILQRVLIKIPILEMKHIADKNKIKLVYVFISPGNNDLKDFLKSAGVDYVDCSLLLADEIRDVSPLQASRLIDIAVRFYRYPVIRNIISFTSLGKIDPVIAIDRISQLNEFRFQHQHRYWIDGAGHPSRRGNLLIAQAIAQYLKRGALIQ